MKKSKGFLTLLLVVVFAVGLLGYGNFFSGATKPPDKGGKDRVPCINSLLPIPPEYHIHPHLKIVIDGTEVPVPANIGLSIVGCERVVHTHDRTGQIHIEPNEYYPYALGDFFWVWDKTFSKTQILDKVVDAEHEVVMTVDGAPSEEYGDLVLRDKQEIVIEYKERTIK